MDHDSTDPWLWLEDVDSDEALAWVRERNAETERELTALPGYAALRARLKTILDSRDRIPYVGHHDGRYYNFWRDADHERGIWRRTTLDEYRKPAPAWETVLDLDALARHCLTPAECRDLAALPADARPLALLARWTRKEACLKALGTGLQIEPSSFGVGADAAQEEVGLMTIWGQRVVLVQAVEPAPGWIGAVARVKVGH